MRRSRLSAVKGQVRVKAMGDMTTACKLHEGRGRKRIPICAKELKSFMSPLPSVKRLQPKTDQRRNGLAGQMEGKQDVSLSRQH